MFKKLNRLIELLFKVTSVVSVNAFAQLSMSAPSQLKHVKHESDLLKFKNFFRMNFEASTYFL